jgi:hypothetical protein
MLKDEKKAECEVYLQCTIGTEASTMLVYACHADISPCLFMMAWRVLEKTMDERDCLAV